MVIPRVFASNSSTAIVLPETELEDQEASGSKPAGGLFDHRDDEIEAAVAAEQGHSRLVVAHLGLQRPAIALADVGRVGDDQVEVVEGVEHVGVDEADAVRHAVPPGVPPGDDERGFGNVGRHDRRLHELARQRDGQASAAGSRIGDRQRAAAIAAEAVERGLDNQLGFRTRNQDRRRHLERQIPELLPAGDVGGRFTGGAAGDQGVVALGELRGFGLVRRGEIARGVPAEDVFREPPGAQLRLGGSDAGITEYLARCGHAVLDRYHGRTGSAGVNGYVDTPPAVASFSFSER